MDQLDSIKIKNVCSERHVAWKDKPWTGRRYLQRPHLLKDIPKIYKEVLKRQHSLKIGKGSEQTSHQRRSGDGK